LLLTIFTGSLFAFGHPHKVFSRLNVKLLRSLVAKWKDIEGLKLYNPPLIDPRITRQKGLFTIHGLRGKAVEDLYSHPELIKHDVPAEHKKELLEILYTMGIDRSTLFPDLDGLCARINWETTNRVDRKFPPLTGARVVYASGKIVITGSATGTLTTAPP
jgi:hypothetical protein